MTKTGKRILTVSIVCFMVLWIGYLVFTGNHMSSFTKDFEDYKSVAYAGKDGTMVAFTENGALYDTVESTVIMLEFMDYSEGVITMEKKDDVYTFVAVGKDMLYDANKKQILTRRGAYG